MSYKTLPCLGLLIGLALPAAAVAISARLEAESIRLGETVRLVLETDAQPETSPDLTPLQRDFQIVGRSSSRQISEVNGRRQERHELRLILSPRRSGLLVIPPIPFGETSTQAMSLTLGAGSIQPPQETASTPPTNPVTPFTPPQAPGVGPDTSPLPSTFTSLSPPVLATAGHPPTGGRIEENPPLPSRWSQFLTQWSGPVIGMFLLVLIGWGWGWHRFSIFSLKANRIAPKVVTRVPKTPKTQPQPLIIQPLRAMSATPPLVNVQAASGDLQAQEQPCSLPTHHSAAIAGVRLAYENTDAAAARDALLTWAALVFPDRPPGNLALLARRCPEPLRSEILLLEQAFFSPHPLDWNKHRVWEQLPGFTPLPPEEPVSFRQKRPLRRPVAPA